MAKPLTISVPTSSVARVFDVGAAAEALAPPSPIVPIPSLQAEPQRPPASLPVNASRQRAATPEQPVIKRELVLTASTDDALQNLVDAFRRSTRTRLTTSHVARALLKAVELCRPQIIREAKKLGAMKLPANARAWEKDRERFEAQLADVILAGIREADSAE
jgi:hypothetical protein